MKRKARRMMLHLADPEEVPDCTERAPDSLLSVSGKVALFAGIV